MFLQRNKGVICLILVWGCFLASLGALEHKYTSPAGARGLIATEQDASYKPHVAPIDPPGPLSSAHGHGRFDHIIREAAEEFGIDFSLIKGIIKAESQFNPRAVSQRGARGLMQLMPATAHALGVENLFNPRENIFAGVKYYKQLLTHFEGNHRLALAAYNAGISKVKEYGGIPPFPVTIAYLSKVLYYARQFEAS
jgi:soluble lytic murein transglycosylase-like protein